MKADKYRFDGSRACDLRALSCDGKDDAPDKDEIIAKTAENLQKMAALQDAFYADGREGLIIVLQALDAAGKDGTVKHVMSGLNPQGVQVTSFKQPNSEELKHDFLWRVNKALPPRGTIAIFNRSYYEDVLVVQVHDLQKTYQMADRVLGRRCRIGVSRTVRSLTELQGGTFTIAIEGDLFKASVELPLTEE